MEIASLFIFLVGTFMGRLLLLGTSPEIDTDSAVERAEEVFYLYAQTCMKLKVGGMVYMIESLWWVSLGRPSRWGTAGGFARSRTSPERVHHLYHYPLPT